MRSRRARSTRRRIVATLAILGLLSSVQVFTSMAAVPGVSEIERGGFGTPKNAYSWSMAWFKGKLYIGTAAFPMCVENALMDFYYPGFGLYQPHPAPDLSCAPDKYDLDLRAEIWQFNPSTQAWTRVYQSPTVDNPRAPGKSIAQDIGYRGMAVMTDAFGVERLYVGGVTAAEYIPELSATAPPRILVTTDGQSFTALNGAPGQITTEYGTYNVIGYRGLTVLQNRLFALASQSYVGDGAVVEVIDPLGATPNYVQVSPTTVNVFEIETFNNNLYLGTGSSATGYGVWRAGLSAQGSPFAFSPVVTNGAGRGTEITSVVAMHVFRDRLYVGASGWYSTLLPGSELIRIAKDDSWQLVVGNSRTLSSGKYVSPISGLPDGYGNVFNAHFWRMTDLQGALYLGTNDWSWALRGVPIFDFLLGWQYGYDVYSSCDGQYWALATPNAFGDGLYNFGARTMLGTPAGGFIGSANHSQGTAVWRANTRTVCRTPFPWRSRTDPRGGSMAANADGTVDPPTRVLTTIQNGATVVSWDAVAGASQYRVMRAEYETTPAFKFAPSVAQNRGYVPDFPPPVEQTGTGATIDVPGEYTEVGTTTDTFFTDTSAAAGAQYDYQVVAETASGVESDPSNTASSETAAREVTFGDVRDGIAAAAGRGDLVSGGRQALLGTLKRAEWAVSKGFCDVAAKSFDDLNRKIYASTGSGGRVASETTREDLGDLVMRLSRQVTYGAASCR